MAAAIAASVASALAVPLPLPQPRPPDAASAPEDGPPPDVPLQMPRPRPAEPPLREAQPDPPPAPVDAGQEVACRQRLLELEVEYEDVPPIDGEGTCGAAAPVRVSGLGGGIALTPPATLNCEMAQALARWAREVVVPAAERHLGSAPTAVVSAASYVCRTRNNRPGAKLSEHATANAIDVGGIAFAKGESVPILARSAEHARERAFQRAIRRGACTHFTTVIGPGTNAAHATHFHFDLAQRRGGYRLCE